MPDQEIKTFIADNAEELNPISKEDVELIKIKLGKSNRKESDWAVIKAILLSRNVIVAEPEKQDHRVSAIKHILCVEGKLIVFTNIVDCYEHIIQLNRLDGVPGRSFQFSTKPFKDAMAIAKENGMDLYIDSQVKVNTMCMCYVSGEERIISVMVANP